MPTRTQVDAFLPPYEPRQVLDPADPVSIGAMVGPGGVHRGALPRPPAAPATRWRCIPRLAAEFAAPSGATRAASLDPYRTEGADTVVVALGSVLGTLQDTVDDAARRGRRASARSGVTSFRPFPADAVPRRAGAAPTGWSCSSGRSRSGPGGIVSADVRAALAGTVPGDTVIAGLGGRPVTPASLRELLDRRGATGWPGTFLDLDHAVVDRERAAARRAEEVRS